MKAIVLAKWRAPATHRDLLMKVTDSQGHNGKLNMPCYMFESEEGTCVDGWLGSHLAPPMAKAAGDEYTPVMFQIVAISPMM